MRHLLCLTFCWIVTSCWAQQDPIGPVPTPDLAQDATSGHAIDDLFGGPAVSDELPTTADDEQRPARRSRGKSGLSSDRGAAAIPNPFDLSNEDMMMMGEMEGYEEMEMDEMMEGGGAMGMGMSGGMGMGMEGMDDYGGGYGHMYGGGMGTISSADQRFQAGLQRAIAAIRKSESEENRKTLLNFVRQAFEDRYDESIQSRQKQLSQIKQRVAKLEVELKRREAAKSRVVEVQLQSVQLAAEGLLELDGQ